jgi:hypothetical protein
VTCARTKKIYGIQLSKLGHAKAQLVEALRYKSEGRGFDSRLCHWNFFVDIIFYIENKQSYNYLKNVRSFCATRYYLQDSNDHLVY